MPAFEKGRWQISANDRCTMQKDDGSKGIKNFLLHLKNKTFRFMQNFKRMNNTPPRILRRLFPLGILLLSIVFMIAGCDKRHSNEIDDPSADLATFKKKAAQLGKLHNDALSYVAIKHDISSLSISSFRSTIYSFAPVGSGFTYFNSKFEFDSKGLSFDQVLDKYFGSNTTELRAILRKAKNAPQTFSNLNEYHAYYDGLVNEVAVSRTLPEREADAGTRL